MSAAAFRLPALYPIVNVADAGAEARERAFALAVELAEGGATLLQLRAKALAAGAMTQLAARIVEALAGSGTQVIVNDRADVAAACAAAGVHLGDEDLPVEAARRVLRAPLAAPARRGFTAPPGSPRAPGAGAADAARPPIVGYSTHGVVEAAAASASGADYLGFGPVFESPTKAGVRDARGLTALAAACRATTLPVVAIGGVTLETAPACWQAGAASVAVISEIERSGDRRALVAAYRRAASEAGLG